MLSDRIEECRERIGKMCAEQRPPKMRIPVTADDDDMFIDAVLKECGEALAGIPDPSKVKAVLLAAQALVEAHPLQNIGTLLDRLHAAVHEMWRIE